MKTKSLTYRRILQAADVGPIDGIPDVNAAGEPRHTTSAAAAERPFSPTTPFDSSMALTILVLLTALFFLGFFSVYIRRFASGAAEDGSPSPRSLRRPPPSKGGDGLDTSAVKSLPLVAYGGAGAAKHRMIDDCPICLSEFSEGETVKLIPNCGHVFHPICIDTWLSTHVTCPLCRSAQLFKSVEEEEEVCLDVTRDEGEIGATGSGERSTAEEGDAWRDESLAGLRRTSSASDLCNRTVLQRSHTF